MTIHPTDQLDLWPLHKNSSVGNQLIAGSTLHDLQAEYARGLKDAHLPENAWVTKEDWQRLGELEAPAVLRSTSGAPLAWTGNDHPSEDAAQASASEDSFLIQFPWEFITINERLVAQLSESKHDGNISPAAHIDGIIHLGSGSKILPGVVIEGNVVIGNNCKIGPNCYLRGSTTIGNDCHIGQAVEIKNSIIGNNSSIGHLSYVGDSVIGNDVNFGAGTITSNLRHDGTNHLSRVRDSLVDTGRRKFGTVVGDGSHTGILTAIYPGRKLGPNSQTLPNQTVKRDIT